MMIFQKLCVQLRTGTASIRAGTPHTRSSAVAVAQKLVDQRLPWPQVGSVGAVRRFSSIGGGGSNTVSAAASASSSSANGSIESLPVMVKIGVVGDPSFDLYKDLPKGFSSMSKLELLQFFARSDTFSLDMKDASPSKCTVLVGTGNGDAPAPQALLLPLSGTKTIAQVVEELRASGAMPAAAPKIFLRIRLPDESKTLALERETRALERETLARDVLMGKDATPDVVWAALAPQWRAAAENAASVRKRVAEAPMLLSRSLLVPTSAAKELGVDVLCEDKTGNSVKMGVFTMPYIESTICEGPKGLDLGTEQRFFLDSQRNALTQEFVDAMMSRKDNRDLGFGVLLSGPNGVGKSLVGVQAFMTCFAQGLPVVYISSASAWVAEAERGRGDQYFLDHLLRQNADLIAANPVLRKALAPALSGGPLDASVMWSLMDALTMHRGSTIGVIIDDVQAITKVLQEGSSLRIAASYFWMWNNWDKPTRIFVRMEIASNHGLREFELPSGEEGRLRVVRPWTREVVDAAMRVAASPLAFEARHKRQRDLIAHFVGGIPRALFNGREKVLAGEKLGKSVEEVLEEFETSVMLGMTKSCEGWFKALPPSEQDGVAERVLSLVRGELGWGYAKPLYDEGLVARCDEGSSYVRPVSDVAASVIPSHTVRAPAPPPQAHGQ